MLKNCLRFLFVADSSEGKYICWQHPFVPLCLGMPAVQLIHVRAPAPGPQEGLFVVWARMPL
jgi:hypothetical protein